MNNFGDRIKIISDIAFTPDELSDYLLAFEVLEHIDDDLQALQTWSKLIKTNGRIIVSVPAHKIKFSKIDELVGHVRRYERQELFALLSAAGFQNIKIINYGYPLTELSRYLSILILKREQLDGSSSAEERSLKSSYSRPKIISSLLSKIPDAIFMPFKYVQRIFYSYDLGDGLIAIADKI